jgi:membrane protein EpsK
MSAPRFSIIVPAFNAEATLGESIDSVLNQSLDDWELIVVDDGSLDSTLSVAHQFAVSDQRIHVLSQENSGAGEARNSAAKNAAGEYLVLLDADDLLDSNYLASQSAFITEHPGAAIYSVHAMTFDEAGEHGPWHRVAERAEPYSVGLEDLLETNPIYVSACVSSEAFHSIGGFNGKRYAEDYDLWVRLIASGYRHWTNPRTLARYRLSSVSKSADRERELHSVSETLQGVVESTDLPHKDLVQLSAAAHRAAALARRHGLEARARSGELSSLRDITPDMRSAYGGRMKFLMARTLGAVAPSWYLRHVAQRRASTALSGHVRSQFGVNVRANALLLGLQTAVGLWFAPYLIRHLGMAVYGLLPLANSVASYMSVLEISVRGSLSRELSRAFAVGGSRDGNVVLNTALWASVGLGLILAPFAAAVSLSAPNLFNVPAGYETSSRVLFGLILLMYLVGMVRSILTTVPFTRNRLDLQNVTPMSEIVVRVVVVVSLFFFAGPRIEWVALSLVVSGLVATVVAFLLNRSIAPDLRVDRRDFDKSLLRQMWSTSSWMMVNQVGTLLFLSIDVVVVNLVLGPNASGRYGSLLLWSVFLRSLAGAVSSAVTPVALRKHALGEHESLARVTVESVGLLGMAIALPVGALCGFASPLLAVWLGPEFSGLSTLLIFQVFHLSLNLAVLPMFAVQLAAGKVRIPGIVTLAGGVANVALAFFMVNLGNNGLGVALAGALVLTAKNALFTTAYTARIQGVPWHPYMAALLKSTLVALVVFIASRVSLQAAEPQGWISLGIQGVVVVGTCAIAAYGFMLSKSQRQVVRSLVGLGRA